MFCSELKMLLHKNRANCSNVSFSEELVLFGTTSNCTTDKPFELIILLAQFNVTYKCKLQCSMPVLSTLHATLNLDIILKTTRR